MSVRRAQREIDPEEFKEWRAFLTYIEPHGVVRGDLQAGIIAAAVRNALRGPEDEPFKATDFLPEFKPPDEPAEPQAPKVDVRAEADALRVKIQMMRMVEAQRRKEAGQSPRSEHSP